MLFGSISEFTRFLSGAIVEHTMKAHHALERAALLVEKGAKDAIGEYQAGWPQLAASTVEEKTRLGYSPPDHPLLRTGDLRDSIGHEVVGIEAAVGSTSEVAVWQEMGTATIPPRSFLVSTMVRHEAEIVEMLGKGAIKGLVKDDVP